MSEETTSLSEVWQHFETLNPSDRKLVVQFIQGVHRQNELFQHIIAEAVKTLGLKWNAYEVANQLTRSFAEFSAEYKGILAWSDQSFKTFLEHREERKRVGKKIRTVEARRLKAEKELAKTHEQLRNSTDEYKRLQKLADFTQDMPPVPDPVSTASELARFRTRFSGVYFGYNNDGRVVYVGESSDVPRRLQNHEHVKPDELVSFIQMEPSERFFAECYYIWLKRPERNKEGKKTAGKRCY